MKQYYDANKTRMIQQIMQRQRLIRNSDKHMEGTRENLIHDLNDGTRKYLHMRTLAKYNINIDPKTLKYYHNTVSEKAMLEAEPAQQDETTPTELMIDDVPTSTPSDDNNESIVEILDKTELTDTDRTILQNYAERYKKHKRKKATIKLIRERVV